MTDLDASVSAFAEARSARPAWPGVPEAVRPASIAEGYQLQQAIHRRLATQGERRAGYY